MLLITTVGTLGYMVIENWNFFDSIYMTIITMSTVGFGEVHELSFEGKMFTSFLIISCFGTFAYAISSVSSYIVGGEYKIQLREYRLIKKINRMENHVIICGFGRVGKQVAKDLKSQGEKFLIIEKDETVFHDYLKNNDYTFIQGDATNDEVLINANLTNAKAVITCLPKDPDNIYVVLSAGENRSGIPLIARASDENAIPKLTLAGATRVIMPDSIGGSHMASLITNPGVTEFMEYLKVQGNKDINIESLHFDKLTTQFQNKSIKELDLNNKTGVSVIGFRTPKGEYLINPEQNTKIELNSQLIILGTTGQIQKMNAYLNNEISK